ncbi:hypothetical protein SDC9_153379 [bioreactor metagenome]|uniref:Uncharacterized protein n=1 Tax=bioreactor metagenome TaxID=1076179 RepID=A0A645F0F9_9ZZZZ
MFLLHAFHKLLLTYLFPQILPDASHTFPIIFFESFHGAGGSNVFIDQILECAVHIRLLHFDTVQLGLVQKKLPDGQLLRNETIGISFDALVLHQNFFAILFHLRFQDGFIAHNPHNLVNYIVLGHKTGSS